MNSKRKYSVLYSSLFLELIALPISLYYAHVLIFFIVHSIAIFLFMNHLRITQEESNNLYGYFTFVGVIVSIGLPVFGVAGYVIIRNIFLKKKQTYHAEILDEYNEYLTESANIGNPHSVTRDVNARLREETDFESFGDIIDGSDSDLKSKVISKLSQDPSHYNVELLRRALRDNSHEVKLYASSALLKIDEHSQNRIEVAQLNTEQMGNKKSYNELGLAYVDYIASGLLPTEVVSDISMKASEAFRNSLDIDSDQKFIVLQYIRCLIRSMSKERVSHIIDHALAVWPDECELKYLKAEYLFTIKDFTKIPGCLKSIEPDQMSAVQKDVYTLWNQ